VPEVLGVFKVPKVLGVFKVTGVLKVFKVFGVSEGVGVGSQILNVQCSIFNFKRRIKIWILEGVENVRVE